MQKYLDYLRGHGQGGIEIVGRVGRFQGRQRGEMQKCRLYERYISPLDHRHFVPWGTFKRVALKERCCSVKRQAHFAGHQPEDAQKCS